EYASRAAGAQDLRGYVTQAADPGAYGGYGHQGNHVPALSLSPGPTIPVSLEILTKQERTFIPYQSITLFDCSKTSSDRKRWLKQYVTIANHGAWYGSEKTGGDRYHSVRQSRSETARKIVTKRALIGRIFSGMNEPEDTLKIMKEQTHEPK
ncbi:hypothetical protein PybrP1_012463, partial [[Pythium] brassicae (nom. inval.)]